MHCGRSVRGHVESAAVQAHSQLPQRLSLVVPVPGHYRLELHVNVGRPSGRSEIDLRPTLMGGAHQYVREVAPLLPPVISDPGR